MGRKATGKPRGRPKGMKCSSETLLKMSAAGKKLWSDPSYAINVFEGKIPPIFRKRKS